MPDEEFEEDQEPSEADLDDELADDEFASPPIDEEDMLVEDSEELVDEDIEDVDDEVEDEDDEVVDLEEELHPDDVEEPLDVLLLERTSSGLLDEDEYDEEEDDTDSDERADPGSRIPPRRPGEFVCRSCFLVKHPSQLADSERVLCSDCV